VWNARTSAGVRWDGMACSQPSYNFYHHCWPAQQLFACGYGVFSFAGACWLQTIRTKQASVFRAICSSADEI